MRSVLLLVLVGCEPKDLVIGKGDTGAMTESQPTIPPDDTDPTTGDDDSDPPTDDSDTTDTTPVVVPDWTVDCKGAADFSTINDAIAAASSGDHIAVAPCKYREIVNFAGKSLDIYSTDGPEVTIIDADEAGTVVDIEANEGVGTRLAGFTITDGYDNDGGSAIEITQASVELDDLIIEGNNEGLMVIRATVAWVDYDNVVIRDNVVVEGGYGIWADGGSMTAEDLTVDCSGGTYALWQHHATVLDRSTLTCETGIGLYSYHGEVNVMRSTITGRDAGLFAEDEEDSPSERALISNSAIGGDLIGLDIRYMHLEIENSVLWGETAAMYIYANDPSSTASGVVFMGGECGVQSGSGVQNMSIRYGSFYDNTADGCDVTVRPTISDDPMFVSFPDDLSLRAGSPLIDAGDPSVDDPDGSQNDIGMYGGPGSAWF